MTNFCKKLINITHATDLQKKTELWDIEGIIKDHSNQRFKFDTRPMKNDLKKGYFKTKADKIVFEKDNQFIVVETEELHKYLKKNKLKEVNLEELVLKLEWNIILPKFIKPYIMDSYATKDRIFTRI
jgi:hypothetical protein|tara:strand:- start:113 stop:493 length:381 start_codon:yes stop_codon:yes gene_type:complete